MPYNGSGTYTLSDTIAPNTLADATEVQNILNDIQSALNVAFCRDGQASMSAPLKLAAGTAAAPGLAFDLEASLGLYRKTAGVLAIASGGAERVSFSATGVAITGTLDVSGNVAVATNKFTVNATSGNTAVAGNLAINTNKFTVDAATGNTTVAGTLNAAGNLAINTDKFTVNASTGDAAVAGILTANQVSAATFINAPSVGSDMVATQAEQEAASVTTKVVTPGRQHFHPSAAKAWVKATTIGTVVLAYNVSSVTDDGTGLCSATLATAFSSADYAVVSGVILSGAAFPSIGEPTTATGFQMRCHTISGAQFDPNYFTAVAFGDQ